MIEIIHGLLVFIIAIGLSLVIGLAVYLLFKETLFTKGEKRGPLYPYKKEKK